MSPSGRAARAASSASTSKSCRKLVSRRDAPRRRRARAARGRSRRGSGRRGRARSPLSAARVPGEQAIDQRVIGAGAAAAGQIGERQRRRTASARRAGASPDRADRRSRAAGRGPGAPRRVSYRPSCASSTRGDAARRERVGDLSATPCACGSARRSRARADLRPARSSSAISSAIASRQRGAHDAHRQLSSRRRPARGAA